ncbi:MAG TPA: hypothetical protein DFS52_04550 [Myxococcales bacterium]|nr:hypothetical protein [Myxococcales bacterium]
MRNEEDLKLRRSRSKASAGGTSSRILRMPSTCPPFEPTRAQASGGSESTLARRGCDRGLCV